MKICNIINSSSRIIFSEFAEEAKYVDSPVVVTRGFDNWDWKLLRPGDLGYQANEAVWQRNIARHNVPNDGLVTLKPLIHKRAFEARECCRELIH